MKNILLALILASSAYAQVTGFGTGGNPKINGICPPWSPQLTNSSLGAACSCPATATDSHGIPITSTRALAGTCSTSQFSTPDGGDWAYCPANLPRVMSNGTGALGYLVESAASSPMVAAKNFADPSWIADGTVTVVVSDGGAEYLTPAGTYDATLVTFGAVSGASKGLFATAACPGGGVTETASAYFKVKGAAGTTGKIYVVTGSTPYSCDSCTVTADTWTRCAHTGTPNGALMEVGHPLLAANNCPDSTATTLDVYVWGGQCETAAMATSLVPDGGIRNADVISMPAILTGNTISVSATYNTPAAYVNNATVFDVYANSNNYVIAYMNGSGNVICDVHTSGSAHTKTSSGTLTKSADNTVACYYDGTNEAVCLNGTCETAALSTTLPTGAATFYLGTRSSTGNEAQGIIKTPCLSGPAWRCR